MKKRIDAVKKDIKLLIEQVTKERNVINMKGEYRSKTDEFMAKVFRYNDCLTFCETMEFVVDMDSSDNPVVLLKGVHPSVETNLEDSVICCLCPTMEFARKMAEELNFALRFCMMSYQRLITKDLEAMEEGPYYEC